MTSTDGNDFVPTQEKLEWVTPKISLMDAGETTGNKALQHLPEGKSPTTWNIPNLPIGPS